MNQSTHRAAEELIAARSAYAALQERQVIEDRVHGSVLQELFAAALLLDAAAGVGGDVLARLEEANTYVRVALSVIGSALLAHHAGLRLGPRIDGCDVLPSRPTLPLKAPLRTDD
ncbi:hypothetical protein LQK93_00170 [Terrabacter sp. BE26]